MGNANENNPYGSVNYNVNGYQTITDPSSGNTYQVPTFDRNVSLSPNQQQMLSLQQQTGMGLDQIALNQTGMLGDLLNNPLSANNVLMPTQQIGQPLPLNYSLGNVPQLQNSLGQAPNLQNVNLQTSTANPANYTQDAAVVQNAIMQRAQPYLQAQQQALQSQLANQGYAAGSDAYKTQMGQFNQQQNDFALGAIGQGYNTQLALANQALQEGNFHNNALLGQAGFNNQNAQNVWQMNAQNAAFGNQAQQAQFGMGAENAQFGNQAQNQNWNMEAQNAALENNARTQMFQGMLALRNQPINEISALLNGGQVNMPQFAPYQFQPMQPAPVGQYTYNSANLAEQNYQSQLQSYNAGLSGMFGLGSSLIGGMAMMSDRRLKQNVIDLGIRLLNGAKLYAYEYIGGAIRHVGVMAQEIEKLLPEAVVEVGGFKAVDYARVFNG